MVAEFRRGATSRAGETTTLGGSFERQHPRSGVALEDDAIAGGIAPDDPCGSVGLAHRRFALGGYGPIAGEPAIPNGGGDDGEGGFRRGGRRRLRTRPG